MLIQGFNLNYFNEVPVFKCIFSFFNGIQDLLKRKDLKSRPVANLGDQPARRGRFCTASAGRPHHGQLDVPPTGSSQPHRGPDSGVSPHRPRIHLSAGRGVNMRPPVVLLSSGTNPPPPLSLTPRFKVVYPPLLVRRDAWSPCTSPSC